MSDNGKWLAPMATESVYSWEPGYLSIEKESRSYATLYNLETGELTKFENLGANMGWYSYGVSNDGDIISSDGIDFYLKPAGTDKAFELSEWLHDEYQFDLWTYLPPNTEYIECSSISSDMTVIVGVYRSVTPEGELDNKEVFCVKLPGFMSNIKETLNTPQNSDIVMAGNELSFGSEATDIVVYDLCGKQVMSHNARTSTLNVEALSDGVYVVKAEMNGAVATGKVYKL